MSSAGKVVKNTLFLNVGHIISKVINLGLVIILTRHFGTEGFGKYSFAFSFVMLFMVFTQLGMNTFLVQYLSRDLEKVKATFNAALPVVFILSVITIVLVNLTGILFKWNSETLHLVFLFSIYLFFDGFSRFGYAIFRAFQQMKYEAITYVAERFLMLFFALILWYLSAELTVFVAAFAFVEFVKASIAFGIIHKKFARIKPIWRSEKARFLLEQSLPFALMLAFGNIIFHIDTVMLRFFHTDEVVGVYSAGRRLIESLIFVPETMVVALFPALSALFVKDLNVFKNNIQRAFELMLMLAIPLTALIFFYAENIILLLFDSAFSESAIVLKWLSIWLGIVFLKHLSVVMMNAMGLQKSVSMIIAISLILNVVLNLLLIPQYSYLGACIATISAELSTAIIAFYITRNKLIVPKFTPRFFRLLFFAILWVALLISSRPENMFVGAPVFAALYFGVVYKLNIFQENELLQLTKMFKKR